MPKGSKVKTNSIKDKKEISTLDAFSNPLFRLGYGSQSPIEATEYPLTRMTDNYALLNSLYRDNWVVQNVVGLVVDDMMREWYALNADISPEEQKALGEAERKLCLRARLNEGLRWGRLYGGAAGLIMINGQEGMLDRPLDIDTVYPGSFQGLYILDRWQGITPDYELIFEGGEPCPVYYSITDAKGTTITKVHHSRIVRFTGRDLPFLERVAEMYWGESEIEALYKEVAAHDNVSANMAALTFQANINTMEVQNLDQLFSLTSTEQQRRFWNTMQAQSVMRTNYGLQLVNKGDQIKNTQYTFSGLQEVYESMCLNLCGASHYPMTKLFGRSPSGMNATGESDLKNYYDYVDSQRETKLRPALEQLLPVLLMSAIGRMPETFQVSFPPLWTPTAKETAEIAKVKAETIVTAYQAGLLNVDTAQQELRKLEEETGLFGSITDKEIEANAGKTYQDATALRDPLTGLDFEPSEMGEDNQYPFESETLDTLDYNPYHDQANGKFTSGQSLTSGDKSGILQSSEQRVSANGGNKFEKGFSGENLKRHFNKHGTKDYPGMSEEEYNRYALKLVQSKVTKDILGYKTMDNAVVRYKISTNDFVKGYPKTGIATMYKPKGDKAKGYKYFLNKQKEEGIIDD